MFSGITQGIFPVSALEKNPAVTRYSVKLNHELTKNLNVGASVSIDGVCQSATEIHGDVVSFEAVQETLQRSTLSDLVIGRMVSVERSLRIGDELGGHQLSGHIIGTATVQKCEGDEISKLLQLSAPTDWLKFIFEKGFIALDGSSLTVGDVSRAKNYFEVFLIPDTIRRTRLGALKKGDRVNVEVDAQSVAVVDTVERILGQDKLPVT